MSGPPLMTTPSDIVLSRLSRPLYLQFLAKAKARGFAFVRFQDFLPRGAALPRRYLALTHHLDFAPRYAGEMAELEHAAGVVSTFFVLADDHFYGLLQREVVLQIRRIHALGQGHGRQVGRESG